jgi:hypothetical protein
MGSRRRKAWLLLIKAGTVHEFSGSPIEGVVVIVNKSFTKNGVWSHDTFELALAEGVRFVPGKMGWDNGTFLEGLSAALGTNIRSWVTLANALNVTMEEAMRFIAKHHTKSGEELNRIERELAALDDVCPEGAAEMVFTFGSPNRRMREEGWWDWPVVVRQNGNAIAQLTLAETGWVSNHPSVKVVRASHGSGRGGGFWTLTVVGPDGVTMEKERA